MRSKPFNQHNLILTKNTIDNHPIYRSSSCNSYIKYTCIDCGEVLPQSVDSYKNKKIPQCPNGCFQASREFKQKYQNFTSTGYLLTGNLVKDKPQYAKLIKNEYYYYVRNTCQDCNKETWQADYYYRQNKKARCHPYCIPSEDFISKYPKFEGWRLSGRIYDNQPEYVDMLHSNKRRILTTCVRCGKYTFKDYATHKSQPTKQSFCKTREECNKIQEYEQKYPKFDGYLITGDDYLGSPTYNKIGTGDYATLIKCKKCGNYFLQDGKFLRELCYTCDPISSIAELKIEEILKQHNIKYEKEKTFNDCVNPKTNHILYFDFYLSDYNILIEFDGEQHFKPFIFGNEETFESTQYLDGIKTQYCKQNNIKLLRITYKDNIDEVLKHFIAQLDFNLK